MRLSLLPQRKPSEASNYSFGTNSCCTRLSLSCCPPKQHTGTDGEHGLRLFRPMKLFIILSFCVNWSTSLVLAWTFFLAFFDPSKTALVHINNYGEAIPEAFLVPIVIISGLVSIITLIKWWYIYPRGVNNVNDS